MSAEKYGNLYFGVQQNDGVIRVMADTVSVSNSGDLMFINHGANGDVFYGLIYARGQWDACAAISCIDGGVLIVDKDVEEGEEDNEEDVKTFAQIERAKMTASLRYTILERDGFRCQACGAQASDGTSLHVDHIIPVSKGGMTEEDNLQALCVDCNLGKGAR